MFVFVALFAAALLAAHVYTFFRTRREKRETGLEPARSTFSKTLIGTLLVLDLFVIGMIGIYLLLLFAFEARWYMKLGSVLACLLVLGLLFGLLFRWFNGRRFLAWLACALLVVGGLWGGERYTDYLQSITLRESFDYRDYLPFREDSPLASLDGEATLRFAEGEALPRMDGATALFPVYAAFCEAVYPSSIADNDRTPWEIIDCSTTASAYKHIVDGTRDIIFVAGPSEEQEAFAAEQGVELVYTPIGREAFVFFVHPDNPIDGLTLDEIRAIYAGEITRWDALGVSGLGEILAYQRDEGSGSQTALERFVMRGTPLMPADKEKVVDGMGGMVEKVSAYQNHRNAIGFSFRFYCTALMKGFDVKLLAINGVEPSVENIENGSYPLASSFYAVTRSDADENTLALLDWICGEQGQALIKKTGYTPLSAGG